jgi:hypothetical protein
MYRIVLVCVDVPEDRGETGAVDILQELADRPEYSNVRCIWDGTELTLQADSDWDDDGKNLIDEFSDCISACIDVGFDGDIETRSITVMPDES